MVGIKIVDYILGGIMSELLKVNKLSVAIDDTEILKNIDFTIGAGETHVLMGPNGAGKSTLGFTLMGNPAYEIKSGDIILEGESIIEDGTDVRAKKGLFIHFRALMR